MLHGMIVRCACVSGSVLLILTSRFMVHWSVFNFVGNYYFLDTVSNWSTLLGARNDCKIVS